MGKTTRKVKLRDDTVRIIAEIHGVSPRYVNMVRNGERENDNIMATLIDYQIGKNKLIKHLEELIPTISNPSKYARKKN
jgi:hypothetical protein